MKKRILLFVLIISLLAACSANTEIATVEETDQSQSGLYAVNVFLNSDYHFPPHHKDGNDAQKLVMSGAEQYAFLEALKTGRNEFTVEDISYAIFPLSEGNYQIVRLQPIADVLLGKLIPYDNTAADVSILQEGYDQAVTEGKNIIKLNRSYYISSQSKPITICELGATQMATQAYVEPYNSDNAEITATHQFQYAIENALLTDSRTFSVFGKTFSLHPVPGGFTILDKDGDLFAEWSRYHVVTNTGSVEPPLVFKNKAREAIVIGESSFSYTNADGIETVYIVTPLPSGEAWSVKPEE